MLAVEVVCYHRFRAMSKNAVFFMVCINDLIGIVEPVRAITVHVHGRFINGIRIQLGDVIK